MDKQRSKGSGEMPRGQGSAGETGGRMRIWSSKRLQSGVRRRFRLWTVWLASLICLTGPADRLGAWSFAGHMLCGSEVCTRLHARNPQRCAELVELLRVHPHYASHWRPICAELPVEREAEVLFMLAARWPDDVREAPWRGLYHRRAWHFVNHTLRFSGTPTDVPDGIIPATPEPGEDPEGCHHLETALAYNLTRLTSGLPPERRAVALCWVLHLACDLHQPLHATNRYGLRAPQGDRGGNLAFVLEEPGSAPINLHAFWDNRLPPRSPGVAVLKSTPVELAGQVRDVWDFADEWRARSPQDSTTGLERRRATIAEWSAESVALAREVVYADGRLEVGSQPDQAVPLPEGYREQATRVAERRMRVSIDRLLELLDP